ncbi:Short-chain oxidoreductase [Streptomyces sp. SAT1]|nr:Short-chain oxidoreductase [Streptomyces sp. SAT1]
MSEALADEAAEYGIKALIVGPGASRTSLFGTGNAGLSPDSGVYAGVRGTRDAVAAGDGTQPGDPAKAAAPILAALESDDAPPRLPLGDDAVTALLGRLGRVRDDITAWEKRTRTRATAFDD